jgi:hypothetical protein
MSAKRSSLAAVRRGSFPLRRCRDPMSANVERLLGEGPIKQDETTHVGAGA